MGLWTFAELATGFIISCLPVIPKFFQHMYPKVSRALSVMSKSKKDSGIESAPAALADEPQENLKIKLPSFKHTFASVFSYTEKEDDQELHDYQTHSTEENAILPEQMGKPSSDAARELSQSPSWYGAR